MIQYDYRKDFTKEQVEELFLSVQWTSAKYPEKIVKGLKKFIFSHQRMGWREAGRANQRLR